jgi:hypothetical protein
MFICNFVLTWIRACSFLLEQTRINSRSPKLKARWNDIVIIEGIQARFIPPFIPCETNIPRVQSDTNEQGLIVPGVNPMHPNGP